MAIAGQLGWWVPISPALTSPLALSIASANLPTVGIGTPLATPNSVSNSVLLLPTISSTVTTTLSTMLATSMAIAPNIGISYIVSGSILPLVLPFTFSDILSTASASVLTPTISSDASVDVPIMLSTADLLPPIPFLGLLIASSIDRAMASMLLPTTSVGAGIDVPTAMQAAGSMPISIVGSTIIINTPSMLASTAIVPPALSITYMNHIYMRRQRQRRR